MTHHPCPFCEQPIRKEAIKCRHCRRMLDDTPPPTAAARLSRDFWVPLVVVVAGFAAVILLVLFGRSSTGPTTTGPAAVVLADADAGMAAGAPGTDPTAAAPTSPPVPSEIPADAGDDASDAGAPRLPDSPEPAGRPRTARAPAPFRDPTPPPEAPPGSSVADGGYPVPPGRTTGAAPVRRRPEPPPGPARDLKSDLFGYSMRLPNQRAWRMARAGASRHTVVRRDGSTRIRIWAELRPDGDRADARRCLREYLGNLHRNFARARLGVRTRGTRRHRGKHGVTIVSTERLARGIGPRRYSGHYLVSFAAVGRLCYGFEGTATRPASPQGRREVEAAYRSFDVDPTVVRRAASQAVRANLTGIAAAAQRRRDPAILMDAATALATLWPREAMGWHLLGFAYLLRDDADLAIAALRRARKAERRGTAEEVRLRRFSQSTLLAHAYSREKKWTSAYAAIEEARKILPDHPELAYAEACLHALRGRKEKAMDLIEESFRAWPPRAVPPRIPHGLLVQVNLARRDPRLRSLRGEPRFEVMMRRFEARARKAR